MSNATWTPEQILAIPIPEHERHSITTLRDFFIEMSLKVWRQGDGFSGKRPFGNSGWRWDVYWALFAAGVVSVNPEDEDFDTDEANALIEDAIRSM